MKLSEIAWPIYSLGKITLSKEDGVIFVVKRHGDKEEIELIDDSNLPQKTLALRRLSLIESKVKLFKIKYTIYFIADLIKMAKPDHWFIDSLGRPFKYVKHSSAKLVCKKITKVIPGIGNAIVEVDGLPNRFTSLYPPTHDQKYAGILSFNGMKFLYGYYTEVFKDTRRKV